MDGRRVQIWGADMCLDLGLFHLLAGRFLINDTITELLPPSERLQRVQVLVI